MCELYFIMSGLQRCKNCTECTQMTKRRITFVRNNSYFIFYQVTHHNTTENEIGNLLYQMSENHPSRAINVRCSQS